MTTVLKAEWKRLRHGEPGRRFEDSYNARRAKRDRTTLFDRIVRIGLALVAMAIGVVLVFIPGPAVLFFLIAATLFASESRGVARALDWSELKLRALWAAVRRRWRTFSAVTKIFVGAVVATGGAATGFLVWRAMFD